MFICIESLGVVDGHDYDDVSYFDHPAQTLIEVNDVWFVEEYTDRSLGDLTDFNAGVPRSVIYMKSVIPSYCEPRLVWFTSEDVVTLQSKLNNVKSDAG